MSKHTKGPKSFYIIYNILHDYKMNNHPTLAQHEKALKANCRIHESHAQLLEVVERYTLPLIAFNAQENPSQWLDVLKKVDAIVEKAKGETNE